MYLSRDVLGLFNNFHADEFFFNLFCVVFFDKIWLLSKEIIECWYIGAFKIIGKLLISKLNFLKLMVIWSNYRYRNCQENDHTTIVIEKMTDRWPQKVEEAETLLRKQVLLLWLRLSSSEQENKSHLFGVHQTHWTLSPLGQRGKNPKLSW